DAAIEDVPGELGRAPVEDLADEADDLLEGGGDGPTGLGGADVDGLRQPGDEVAAADPGRDLGGEREGGADGDLDLLGGAFTEEEGEVAPDVGGDRLVDGVPRGPSAPGGDDAAEGHDRDVRGPTTDVDDHRGPVVGHRQPGTDRRDHRLLDEVDPAGPDPQRRLLDGAAFDAGDVAGDAHDDPWADDARHADAVGEPAQHLLRGVGVADDAAPQGLHRPHGTRGPAERLLGGASGGHEVAR